MQYPRALKVEAVERARSGEPVTDIAADLGPSASTVRKWVRTAGPVTPRPVVTEEPDEEPPPDHGDYVHAEVLRKLRDLKVPASWLTSTALRLASSIDVEPKRASCVMAQIEDEAPRPANAMDEVRRKRDERRAAAAGRATDAASRVHPSLRE